VARWREVLASSPGAAAAAAGARLDLTHAHPSGLAQLLAGRPTRLSSLVREHAAHSAARRKAAEIRAAATTLAAESGACGAHLAVGMVSWGAPDRQGRTVPGPGRTTGLPVLLRGCALRPRGVDADDYDLTLDDALVNPELMRSLATGFGLALDGAQLAALAFGRGGFDPRPAFDWLEERCTDVPGFRIERCLVVATFGAGSGAVLADLDAAGPGIAAHPLLSRVATLSCDGQPPDDDPGDDPVAPVAADIGSAVVLAATAARPGLLAGGREPDTEMFPFDLDAPQRVAVEAALCGRNVALEGPPGTGVTHTLATTASMLAALGRRVLVLCPRRASAEAFLGMLRDAGLGDLALDLRDGSAERSRVLAELVDTLAAAEEGAAPRPGSPGDDGSTWQAALTGGTPADDESAQQATLLPVHPDDTGGTPVRARPNGGVFGTWLQQPVPSPLLRARDRLAGASAALHAVRAPWGVSAYEAMVALADLMGRDNPPVTRVRLPEPVLTRLDPSTRERLRTHLHLAAAAGAFTVTAVETRWFDARLTSTEEARRALDAAREARDAFGPAYQRISDVAAAAGLPVPETVAGWMPLLDLLLGVRDTLDVMLPRVFEQSLDDYIAATAPAGSVRRSTDVGWRERTRRRRAAALLVRPGLMLADLHSVLVLARQQRGRWERLSGPGAWPSVPTGLDEAWAAADRVDRALGVLAEVFAGSPAADLHTLPLPELERRLLDLAGDDEGALGQPRRIALLRGLHEVGLGPLVDDLRERRAAEREVDGELDLAWWGGVLESIVNGDARLARRDPEALKAAAEELRVGELAGIADAARRVRELVADRALRVAREEPEQVRWLREEAPDDEARALWPADLFAAAGDLVAALRPVWVASPDVVARGLQPARPGVPAAVDVVIVDDAGSVGIAEAAAALSRGAQVVVGGDRDGLPPPDGGLSTLAAVAAVTRPHRLDRSHRVRDARLLDPLRERYPQRWDAVPGVSAGACVRLDLVIDAVALPGPGEDLAVSSEVEVQRVVDLVAEHATMRPHESLMVIALAERHAERIEEALRAAAAGRPVLRSWLDSRGPDAAEPFGVRTAARVTGLERDAVIVTLGLARTPHGRVLHRFGVIDTPIGAGCLVAAMTRARRRTTVVSSFPAADLDAERLHTDGARLLRQVLLAVGDGADHEPATVGATDRLVADLRERLVATGIPVQTGVGDPEWPIDLVLSDPQPPCARLVALDLDGPRYAARTIRERDRQRGERLALAGWVHHRVAAIDVFRDPAGEVERIRRVWIRAMLDRERQVAMAAMAARGSQRTAAGSLPDRPPGSTPDRPSNADAGDPSGSGRDGASPPSPDQAAPDHAGPDHAGPGRTVPSQGRPDRGPPVLPSQTADDTDAGWGEAEDGSGDDDRFGRERPPHWE